ncbi:serine protease [Chitinophaga sp. MD30]|nr:serine protease [Chitinophaga sp. MD30]
MTYFKKIEVLSTFRIDLILTPHYRSNAADLFVAISNRLDRWERESDQGWQLANNGETVVARLTFFELIQYVLPLSSWWLQVTDESEDREGWEWLQILAGALLYVSRGDREFVRLYDHQASEQQEEYDMYQVFKAMFRDYLRDLVEPKREEKGILYSVSRNRPATISIQQSVGLTKADAGRRLFDIDGKDITWAVLDSGIDATHDAFRKKDPKTGLPYTTAFGPTPDRESNFTRIVATYDFTKFRDVMASIHEKENLRMDTPDMSETLKGTEKGQLLHEEKRSEYIQDISKALKSGRLFDWSLIAPLLRIPHSFPGYEVPKHPHGTHVAGIIGACDEGGGYKDPLVGMCPGIDLYDIRVMNEEGQGEEFNILAALHFVRWLNAKKEGTTIHGANLSFSMTHEVASYACGQTPVCEACERLVAEGIVVVAAAGNLGQALFKGTNGADTQGFRMVNITDPGNAESVITVGATHKTRPHAYGVSYFSSKGPTGDGRIKPDLVAPGEKITSCVLGNGTQKMDGTSMAAPHVSGAAALLLAKHRELIGLPRRVKEILCKTATDLGRERYFQGCGMVDVLRAIQSV